MSECISLFMVLLKRFLPYVQVIFNHKNVMYVKYIAVDPWFRVQVFPSLKLWERNLHRLRLSCNFTPENVDSFVV